MNDYWSECFDPKMNIAPKDFEHTFCRVCRNPTCARSSTPGTLWARRVATQVDRLLNNPRFADVRDPKYEDIRRTDFPSAVREAMRLEISDRRGDWVVPTDQDATHLAASLVAKVTPPSETILQQITIQGSQGEEYEVTLAELPDSNPKWRCTCKAFEFGGGKHCKHITYAISLPAEDEPETEMKGPAMFQRDVVATPPSQPVSIPPMGNVPVPSGGIMVDGSKPPPPKDRVALADPWAPPPPKPRVVPVGGKVVMGGKS